MGALRPWQVGSGGFVWSSTHRRLYFLTRAERLEGVGGGEPPGEGWSGERYASRPAVRAGGLHLGVNHRVDTSCLHGCSRPSMHPPALPSPLAGPSASPAPAQSPAPPPRSPAHETPGRRGGRLRKAGDQGAAADELTGISNATCELKLVFSFSKVELGSSLGGRRETHTCTWQSLLISLCQHHVRL